MSEERTEPATPKKRKKAREDGQVARSTELVGCAVLLGLMGGVNSIVPTIGDKVRTMFVQSFDAMHGSLSPEALTDMARHSIGAAALAALPAMLLAMAIGTGANVLQVGVIVTPKLVQPKANRVDLLQGMKRLFTVRSTVEVLKGLAKLGIVGGSGWHYMATRWESLFRLSGDDPRQISARVGEMTYAMALQMVGTLTVLAALDYGFQRMQYEKSLKMTKQEVKDELRDAEGNPEIKQRIRQRQREFARRRMMADVPTATVVITNPTHYAVALRYELGQSGAPRVVAKGQDHVALKIRELAKENRVPIAENPPLARALHAQAQVGQEIPAELYKAVAEVLALIWRLDNARRAA
jgi:flagellar biosynthetic protein FlhB